MKARLLVLLVVALGCFSLAIGPNVTFSFDGTNPPHAVYADGTPIPDSSATQPQKPIILSNDSKSETFGVLIKEAAFDHKKHNSEVSHSRDGQTRTACVFCHHTEQPPPGAPLTYLKTSERKQVLKAELLEVPNAQAVNSCRHCHFQTAKGSPPMVTYPKGQTPREAKGELSLTNKVAYHVRCITCHEDVMRDEKRMSADPKPNPPKGCVACHWDKSASPTPTTPPKSSPIPTATPTSSPGPLSVLQIIN